MRSTDQTYAYYMAKYTIINCCDSNKISEHVFAVCTSIIFLYMMTYVNFEKN